MVDLCRLLVRKLPSFLSIEDKESLLKFFGAIQVTVMAPKGQMRNCAFATFANPADARMAMTKLHQLNVLGSHLVVVYATPTSLFNGQIDTRWKGDKVNSEETQDNNKTSNDVHSRNTTNDNNIVPRLTYEYPPPTQLIINNIAHAMAAIPVLYTQILHLMNKMNLPPPFGQPLPGPDLPPGEKNSESELSSSDEYENDTKARYIKVGRKRKRMPRQRSLNLKHLKETIPLQTEVVMEHSIKPAKKIEINAPINLLPSEETSAVVENVFTIASTPSITHKDENITNTPQLEESNVTYTDEDFIPYNELQLNRLTIEEMQENGVFKNYSKGEPSMRLYIKNLSKQVTEKDLIRLYGRYVDWSLDEHKNSFDIRVMQQGRMKGQAFVGLPSEEIATRALEETLGYKLYDKPIVIQFARSTKAKEKNTW